MRSSNEGLLPPSLGETAERKGVSTFMIMGDPTHSQ